MRNLAAENSATRLFFESKLKIGNATFDDTVKYFMLLDLPAEQRETFIEQNPVGQMTTRELQAAIKAQKDAEQRALNLAKQLEETMDENQLLRDENRKLAERD